MCLGPVAASFPVSAAFMMAWMVGGIYGGLGIVATIAAGVVWVFVVGSGVTSVDVRSGPGAGW